MSSSPCVCGGELEQVELDTGRNLLLQFIHVLLMSGNYSRYVLFYATQQPQYNAASGNQNWLTDLSCPPTFIIKVLGRSYLNIKKIHHE